MKKIKIIMVSVFVMLAVVLTVPRVYAYTLDYIPSRANYMITVNTHYQPTISNQGDITFDDSDFTTFNQMFAFLTTDYPSEIGIVQIPLRHDSNFTIYNSSNTILYFYEDVRMIAIIFDMYVNQASTKITYYLYSSNGTLITTFNYTWNVTTQAYYHLMTYEINGDYNNGYNQGYNDSIVDNYQPTYQVGYNDGYDDGYIQGLEVEQLDLWASLWVAFTTPFTLFEIEMLPGVTIGMIALIPLVLGLIAFIFSLGGKKK